MQIAKCKMQNASAIAQKYNAVKYRAYANTTKK